MESKTPLRDLLMQKLKALQCDPKEDIAFQVTQLTLNRLPPDTPEYTECAARLAEIVRADTNLELSRQSFLDHMVHLLLQRAHARMNFTANAMAPSVARAEAVLAVAKKGGHSLRDKISRSDYQYIPDTQRSLLVHEMLTAQVKLQVEQLTAAGLLAKKAVADKSPPTVVMAIFEHLVALHESIESTLSDVLHNDYALLHDYECAEPCLNDAIKAVRTRGSDATLEHEPDSTSRHTYPLNYNGASSEPSDENSFDDSLSGGMPDINPATGLPMSSPGCGGIDIGGNVYGTGPLLGTGWD